MTENATHETEEQTPDEEPEHEEQQPETDTFFPRSYVEQLRSEAAEHRTAHTAAQERSEAAESRLRALAVAEATRDVLADPTDLQWDDSMADEQGWPDAERIAEAAEDLVSRKPHLGRVRGSVGQGYRGETQSVSLVEALRMQ